MIQHSLFWESQGKLSIRNGRKLSPLQENLLQKLLRILFHLERGLGQIRELEKHPSMLAKRWNLKAY